MGMTYWLNQDGTIFNGRRIEIEDGTDYSVPIGTCIDLTYMNGAAA